ncbi:imm11 family protein [Corallococcus terminator]|uniref:Immunity MXAN-0049 protein domain-containing protein n=1 Tax=Corallococcus terminator TaxID=2316733 RepID=A0A3A8IKM4_9BACT|nr:DUF1629 domain-containing protein [Corallococcus terminator]RKG84017.1 hypothetical protein D7V88_22905 [Corallococcus terminator]
MMNFFRLSTLGDLNDKELALIDGPPEGMELRSYCMSEGDSSSRFYPKDAKIALQADHPGIKLSSLLGNTSRYLVVHASVKEVISAQCQDLEVEYLPFDLFDHRKRLYIRDYFIINPIGTRDCLDVAASGVKIGPEGSVIHVARFVLDPKKVAPLPALFRPKEEPSVYLVSEALAVALKEKKFTNLQLEPLLSSPNA